MTRNVAAVEVLLSAGAEVDSLDITRRTALTNLMWDHVRNRQVVCVCVRVRMHAHVHAYACVCVHAYVCGVCMCVCVILGVVWCVL